MEAMWYSAPTRTLRDFHQSDWAGVIPGTMGLYQNPALSNMGQLVEDHGIDCDLHFTPWVTLALTAAQAESLRTSYELMVPYGLATDFWQWRRNCDKPSAVTVFIAGLVEPLHAQMWPAKLVFGISRVATEQGSSSLPPYVCPVGSSPGPTPHGRHGPGRDSH